MVGFDSKTYFKDKYGTQAQRDASLLQGMKDTLVPFSFFYPCITLPVESQNEATLLILCTGAESRGENERGIGLVCDCILNRWKSLKKYWGFNLHDVINDRNPNGIWEFSCMDPKSPTYKWMKKPDTVSFCKVANIVIPRYFGLIKPENPKVTYYYNPSLCSPSWAKTLPFFASVGNHNFHLSD